MNNPNKKSIFDDRRVTLVASLVLAAITWIIIAGFINPGSSRPITYINIDYEAGAGQYAAHGLQIVTKPSELPTYADVQVQGDGAVIGPLTASSVSVYADYSGVTGPGVYEVPLRTEKLESGSYNITAVSIHNDEYSLEGAAKGTITMAFEELETKIFAVTVLADGVEAAEGFFRDTPRADPVEVQISGPETRVEQIARVVAEVDAVEQLEERGRYTNIPLKLLDEAGNELDAEAMQITVAPDTVDVEVPILQRRTIGLTVDFAGIPQGLDTEWFHSLVHLSAEELQVAGVLSALDHLEDPYPVRTFSLTEMSLGWESDPINIELPEGSGLRNLDQLRQITVSLDSTTLAEKTIEVPSSNFRVVNAPRNATVTPVADSISVRLLGDAEQLEAILPENISVQIDAFGVSAGSGSQQVVPVRILVSGFDRVFAITTDVNYTLVCDVAVS